ncbi:MAG: zinc ABC transporter substrate-binding protein [Thermoanaerobaculaceae bacterium]|nr:zinc ABC transporter substrate-binding protein [Thermoanaerobaculaceae bacterium]
MKKISALFLLLFSMTSLCATKAVCTLPFISDIVKTIGKDKVEITTLLKPTEDPHYAEPKPSMILAARKCDILFYNGLDLEIGYLPKIIESSNNPKIQPGKDGNVDLSQFISPIEIPSTLDRSMGDIHPLGNPHYNYSPKNIREVAKGIEYVLSKIDPQNKTIYEKNLDDFLNNLSAKEEEWKNLNLKGKKVITYHKILEYLAKEFGFDIVGNIEPKPGIPPSAKHLRSLLETMKNSKIDIILTTNVIGEKEAKYLSEKGGVRMAIIPQDVGGTKEAGNWISMVESVLKKISGDN